jgi:2-polyprenyl-3-methyl-5-hydroxy-6-metoxy-1,4-benzoquinol methylase
MSLTEQQQQAAGIVSPLERQHAPYFVQKTVISNELQGRNRVDVFAQMCAGRRVLHVGCVDWPITDVRSSLHLQLQPHCAKLDGFDIHEEAFEHLRPHVTGQLHSNWAEVTGEYDIVLVPEVMEHVPDVQGFLQQLNQVNAPHFVITVPDAYSCMQRHFDYAAQAETFVEVVHPDHNCWYTPYTFANVVRKYTDWRIDGMWFFNRISMLMIATKPSR